MGYLLNSYVSIVVFEPKYSMSRGKGLTKDENYRTLKHIWKGKTISEKVLAIRTAIVLDRPRIRSRSLAATSTWA